jgi:hypothetical protein
MLLNTSQALSIYCWNIHIQFHTLMSFIDIYSIHSMSGGPLLLFLESPHDIEVVTVMVDSPLAHHSTLL